MAKTSYPRLSIIQKASNPVLIPILSRMIPPRSGKNIFGIE